MPELSRKWEKAHTTIALHVENADAKRYAKLRKSSKAKNYQLLPAILDFLDLMDFSTWIHEKDNLPPRREYGEMSGK